MKFEDLEKICIGLYGLQWKSQVARDLNKKSSDIRNWKAQGVPKWVFDALSLVIEKRKAEFGKSINYFEKLIREDVKK